LDPLLVNLYWKQTGAKAMPCESSRARATGTCHSISL
jgi:hypothetical protein